MPQTARECTVSVGDVTITVESHTSAFARSMRDYFGVAEAESTPHMRLVLEVVPGGEGTVCPDSLFAGKEVSGSEFRMPGGVARGRLAGDRQRGEVQVASVLTNPQAVKVFEQILWQAFYTARKAIGYDAVLVHGCGAIRQGRGFLFSGASGSGKTTIAALSRDAVVLNDEICLVDLGSDPPRLYGTPFNGYFREKQAGSATLAAVCMLARGGEHRILEVRRARGVADLFAQIVPPVGLEEEFTRDGIRAMVDSADRIMRRVPLRRLEFRPDPGFWPVVERAFPPRRGADQCLI
jgi:hypothetical protein